MNVGDYVRTPQGIIAKIINIQEDTGQYFLNGNAVSLESKNYIADKNITIGENFKHSPNIIDLIEVGDYVNGYRVDFTNISEKLSYEDKCVGFYDGDGDINLFKEDIKSIVTHEQFENIEYRVEE